MLVAALHTDRRGALRASLAAEYPGLPTLRTILTGKTDVNALDLADLVEHLPRGCALGRVTGGFMAWTDETHMLSLALNGIDTLAWQNTGIMTRNPRGKQPQPMKPPVAAEEAEVAAARMDAKRDRRQARKLARAAKLRATE